MDLTEGKSIKSWGWVGDAAGTADGLQGKAEPIIIIIITVLRYYYYYYYYVINHRTM